VNKLFELHGQKAGTPTMGGVLILGTVVFSTLLWARPDNSAVWLVVFTLLYCGGLGFWDDYLKVAKKNSAGVSERTKLIGQGILAAIVTAYFLLNPATEVQARELFVPFSKDPVIMNLGALTFVFFAIVIMGSSNAVNLTDGLDGLAAGCTCTASFTYGVLAYAAGNFKIASYLDIPFYPFAGELAVICMAMVGASFGFLWFNCHPAKVFMGDTGSLAIGGMLGVVAICTKQEMLLVLVGGVFVIEAVSVLIQRSWFKITKRMYGEGRRVFLMSPVHHHFELKGWKENTVIVRFWILSIMFSLLGLATLKLR
jgi:phospho-N-acetylmuramoyl-pentapeptide-transferase